MFEALSRDLMNSFCTKSVYLDFLGPPRVITVFQTHVCWHHFFWPANAAILKGHTNSTKHSSAYFVIDNRVYVENE